MAHFIAEVLEERGFDVIPSADGKPFTQLEMQEQMVDISQSVEVNHT